MPHTARCAQPSDSAGSCRILSLNSNGKPRGQCIARADVPSGSGPGKGWGDGEARYKTMLDQAGVLGLVQC